MKTDPTPTPTPADAKCPHCKGTGYIVYVAGGDRRLDECGCSSTPPADAGPTEAEIRLVNDMGLYNQKEGIEELRRHVASCLAEKEVELVAIGAQVGHQPIYSWPVGTTVARRLASLEAENAKLRDAAVNEHKTALQLQADNERLRTALQMMQDKTQWVPFAFETADERAAANVLISSALSSPPPASSASPKGVG